MNEILTFPDIGVSEEIKTLLSKMLIINPNERITWD
jgi:hypothetical protein